MFKLADHLSIASGLIFWRIGVNIGKFRPCDRHHFGCRIQFHRAGSKRYHTAVQRQITIGKFAHIAHHFGFGMIFLKGWMRQIRTPSLQFFR